MNDAPIATFDVDQNVAEGSSTLNGQLTATDVIPNRRAQPIRLRPKPSSSFQPLSMIWMSMVLTKHHSVRL